MKQDSVPFGLAMNRLTRIEDILNSLGVPPDTLAVGDIDVGTPITGEVYGRVAAISPADLAESVERSTQACAVWRTVPAPRRGELVRLFAEQLRRNKAALGALVTIETGKLYEEGLGEVQEMIDICDLAVGLSRQLYGLTMPSERPGHTIAEHWHPMGVVGVITPFNFPAAIWSWNAALALVCGNSVIWKPSEKTPVTAMICEELLEREARAFCDAPDGLMQVAIGGSESGRLLVADERVAVISATGSTRMGRSVAPVVAQRFARCILELGGNNGMIVTPSADLELTERSIVFSALGTTGQRCTTLRRVIVHESVYDILLRRLLYRGIRIGNPFSKDTLMGPLIDGRASERMQQALDIARDAGFPIHGGERVIVPGLEGGHYVEPAMVEAGYQHDLVRTETFAPILYIMSYRDLNDAIALHNDVPQGLSSCIFTNDLTEAETFISALGSDCGIVNVNMGPSGAEIGGAFGGEKETGGGRESGSDAWKGYMRRCTASINYSGDLPLAQGVRFDPKSPH